ncbi:hypothetical protein QN089_05535 [Kurthia sp. YJT4]|uniref:hypothetical protein n=1 Tax=Kurthia sp. YJT4 TaxID=3049086 RepID=UPI00254EB893|nr:hypothetical protein [Kurthia sp. YJT4]WIL39730.1 hypothetical protein QN089_05535 [Kurthia sp. YJT4]
MKELDFSDYDAICAEMKKYMISGDYDKRNELLPLAKKAFRAIKHPYKVGDEVDVFGGSRWQRTVITKVVSNGEIHTPTVVVPITLIRYPKEKHEQMSLF